MEFLKFFFQIGLTGKLVLLFLFFMSFLSWYYIFLNFISLRSFKSAIENWDNRLERIKEFSLFVKEVKGQSGDLLSQSFKKFLTRFAEVYNFYSIEKKGAESFRTEAEKEVDECALIEQERVVLNLGKGLGYLATTASTAPFIGLFGTVWGIMRSFHEIGLKGSASLATVAPGIAEALINTAMGLFVAIPAGIAYNYFVLKKEKLSKELELTYRKILIISKREFLKD
ncbi:hypothetical protein THC_1279 [Caldimicrobium thiodismutans]|jgi:biopolymer transport protein TolQ|uniref:MotA/TolQ/ExbB proton channel domain-containing protein n=1 Tax=Caldimicrobium thiodismutans TaxID=1653476 RepID=A0A0U5AYT6_9BACT|nr:MotA/TolQ/ExbB proton channel family protein [Caldimicrobium thiodismutans]BAU23647.1 hypothetical protein THC_1279 [Caldimicrobium thiodismutans]